MVKAYRYNQVFKSVTTPVTPIFLGILTRSTFVKWRGVSSPLTYNTYLRNGWISIDTGVRGDSGTPLIEFSSWEFSDSNYNINIPQILPFKFVPKGVNGLQAGFLSSSFVEANEPWVGGSIYRYIWNQWNLLQSPASWMYRYSLFSLIQLNFSFLNIVGVQYCALTPYFAGSSQILSYFSGDQTLADIKGAGKYAHLFRNFKTNSINDLIFKGVTQNFVVLNNVFAYKTGIKRWIFSFTNFFDLVTKFNYAFILFSKLACKGLVWYPFLKELLGNVLRQFIYLIVLKFFSTNIVLQVNLRNASNLTIIKSLSEPLITRIINFLFITALKPTVFLRFFLVSCYNFLETFFSSTVFSPAKISYLGDFWGYKLKKMTLHDCFDRGTAFFNTIFGRFFASRNEFLLNYLKLKYSRWNSSSHFFSKKSKREFFFRKFKKKLNGKSFGFFYSVKKRTSMRVWKRVWHRLITSFKLLVNRRQFVFLTFWTFNFFNFKVFRIGSKHFFYLITRLFTFLRAFSRFLKFYTFYFFLLKLTFARLKNVVVPVSLAFVNLQSFLWIMSYRFKVVLLSFFSFFKKVLNRKLKQIKFYLSTKSNSLYLNLFNSITAFVPEKRKVRSNLVIVDKFNSTLFSTYFFTTAYFNYLKFNNLTLNTSRSGVNFRRYLEFLIRIRNNVRVAVVKHLYCLLQHFFKKNIKLPTKPLHNFEFIRVVRELLFTILCFNTTSLKFKNFLIFLKKLSSTSINLPLHANNASFIKLYKSLRIWGFRIFRRRSVFLRRRINGDLSLRTVLLQSNYGLSKKKLLVFDKVTVNTPWQKFLKLNFVAENFLWLLKSKTKILMMKHFYRNTNCVIQTQRIFNKPVYLAGVLSRITLQFNYRAILQRLVDLNTREKTLVKKNITIVNYSFLDNLKFFTWHTEYKKRLGCSGSIDVGLLLEFFYWTFLSKGVVCSNLKKKYKVLGINLFCIRGSWNLIVPRLHKSDQSPIDVAARISINFWHSPIFLFFFNSTNTKLNFRQVNNAQTFLRLYLTRVNYPLGVLMHNFSYFFQFLSRFIASLIMRRGSILVFTVFKTAEKLYTNLINQVIITLKDRYFDKLYVNRKNYINCNKFDGALNLGESLSLSTFNKLMYFLKFNFILNSKRVKDNTFLVFKNTTQPLRFLRKFIFSNVRLDSGIVCSELQKTVDVSSDKTILSPLFTVFVGRDSKFFRNFFILKSNLLFWSRNNTQINNYFNGKKFLKNTLLQKYKLYKLGYIKNKVGRSSARKIYRKLQKGLWLRGWNLLSIKYWQFFSNFFEKNKKNFITAARALLFNFWRSPVVGFKQRMLSRFSVIDLGFGVVYSEKFFANKSFKQFLLIHKFKTNRSYVKPSYYKKSKYLQHILKFLQARRRYCVKRELRIFKSKIFYKVLKSFIRHYRGNYKILTFFWKRLCRFRKFAGERSGIFTRIMRVQRLIRRLTFKDATKIWRDRRTRYFLPQTKRYKLMRPNTRNFTFKSIQLWMRMGKFVTFKSKQGRPRVKSASLRFLKNRKMLATWKAAYRNTTKRRAIISNYRIRKSQFSYFVRRLVFLSRHVYFGLLSLHAYRGTFNVLGKRRLLKSRKWWLSSKRRYMRTLFVRGFYEFCGPLFPKNFFEKIVNLKLSKFLSRFVSRLLSLYMNSNNWGLSNRKFMFYARLRVSFNFIRRRMKVLLRRHIKPRRFYTKRYKRDLRKTWALIKRNRTVIYKHFRKGMRKKRKLFKFKYFALQHPRTYVFKKKTKFLFSKNRFLRAISLPTLKKNLNKLGLSKQKISRFYFLPFLRLSLLNRQGKKKFSYKSCTLLVKSFFDSLSCTWVDNVSNAVFISLKYRNILGYFFKKMVIYRLLLVFYRNWLSLYTDKSYTNSVLLRVTCLYMGIMLRTFRFISNINKFNGFSCKLRASTFWFKESRKKFFYLVRLVKRFRVEANLRRDGIFPKRFMSNFKFYGKKNAAWHAFSKALTNRADNKLSFFDKNNRHSMTLISDFSKNQFRLKRFWFLRSFFYKYKRVLRLLIKRVTNLLKLLRFRAPRRLFTVKKLFYAIGWKKKKLIKSLLILLLRAYYKLSAIVGAGTSVKVIYFLKKFTSIFSLLPKLWQQRFAAEKKARFYRARRFRYNIAKRRKFTRNAKSYKRQTNSFRLANKRYYRNFNKFYKTNQKTLGFNPKITGRSDKLRASVRFIRAIKRRRRWANRRVNLPPKRRRKLLFKWRFKRVFKFKFLHRRHRNVALTVNRNFARFLSFFRGRRGLYVYNTRFRKFLRYTRLSTPAYFNFRKTVSYRYKRFGVKIKALARRKHVLVFLKNKRRNKIRLSKTVVCRYPLWKFKVALFHNALLLAKLVARKFVFQLGAMSGLNIRAAVTVFCKRTKFVFLLNMFRSFYIKFYTYMLYFNAAYNLITITNLSEILFLEAYGGRFVYNYVAVTPKLAEVKVVYNDSLLSFAFFSIAGVSYRQTKIISSFYVKLPSVFGLLLELSFLSLNSSAFLGNQFELSGLRLNRVLAADKLFFLTLSRQTIYLKPTRVFRLNSTLNRKFKVKLIDSIEFNGFFIKSKNFRFRDTDFSGAFFKKVVVPSHHVVKSKRKSFTLYKIFLKLMVKIKRKSLKLGYVPRKLSYSINYLSGLQHFTKFFWERKKKEIRVRGRVVKRIKLIRRLTPKVVMFNNKNFQKFGKKKQFKFLKLRNSLSQTSRLTFLKVLKTMLTTRYFIYKHKRRKRDRLLRFRRRLSNGYNTLRKNGSSSFKIRKRLN